MNIQKNNGKLSCCVQPLLAVLMFALLWISVPLSAQNNPSQPGPATSPPASPPSTMPRTMPPPPPTQPPMDDDIHRWQLANVDDFLDGHPEIAQQLRQNPDLINNEEFLEDHPALQTYLKEHSGIREEMTENPRAFMAMEQRYEHSEGEGGGQIVNDHDTKRWQVANFDQFLDSHREIAEQLSKNPMLVRDEKFVNAHPALNEYLEQHPGIREEFTENPQQFMGMEARYEQQGEENRTMVPARGNVLPEREPEREHVASFGKFLGSRSVMAQQLSNDPSLVNNKEYLASHGDLKHYLKANPAVKAELATNPQTFMKAVESVNGSATVGAKTNLPAKKNPY